MIDVTAEAVIFVLEQVGLSPWQAEQLANDPRLEWSVDALDRCMSFLEKSTADRPVAVLWSYLTKRHTFPPPAYSPQMRVVTEDAPALCPYCKEELAVCQGLHGWAAQYRGVSPAAIFPEDARLRRPRRTRKGPNIG